MEIKSVKFEDVVYFQEGPGVRNWQFRDSGIKLINIRNLVDSELCLENTTNYLEIEEVENKYKHFLLNDGDFVMASSGVTWGKIAEVHEEHLPLCLNTSIIRLVSKDTDVLDKWYLYYYIKSPQFRKQIERLITGSAQPNFGPSHLKKVFINLPDICNQREAIEQFTKVETIIIKRQKELELLDELIKARFVELFEDGESPMKTVEELCSAIVDCPHTTPKYEGELKNPAIRTAEIKKGYIIWETMRYVSDEEYTERTARLKPEAGDIVYGREGTFGNAAILPKGYNFCLGQRVMLLRPDYSKCTSEYLLYAVISDDVYRQAVGKNNASTVAHVNVKDVKQFKIPLPSFDKQSQFATFVEQTDKSKVVVQKALDEAQLLFDSLMQKYFG